MKIKLIIAEGNTLTATLNDNRAAKDFYAMLPLTIEMQDYAGTEKASGSLPKKLDITGAPDGHKPKAGDFAHYAPWNNLAAFYKGDNYARGLVKLGEIDGDFSVLAMSKILVITIESINSSSKKGM